LTRLMAPDGFIEDPHYKLYSRWTSSPHRSPLCVYGLIVEWS
jgi:hypothetical protein